jgi:hypothetical protein
MEGKREAPVSFRPDPALAAQLGARAGDGSRNLVAARDLARYYALLAFSRRRLARLFDEYARRAIVAALGSTFIDESIIPLLGHEIADALVNDDTGEFAGVDVPAILDALKQLTPADLYALGDAVARYQARPAGARPDPCALFGGDDEGLPDAAG